MKNYGTLDGALEYHSMSAGGAAWDAAEVTDEQRTAALVRASRSLDGQYGDRYPGRPALGRSQPLAWPRSGAVDHCANEPLPDDAVPIEIERAAYALALVELLTPGASSPSFTPGAVNKRERVDVIERERFGPSDGVALTLDMQRSQLAEVEDLLRCLLVNRGATQCILRV
ncbi:DnaT-like ssDNA-binding protein [Alcaligenes sp. YSL9]|uniref:DnaT-like ssDNA-binding protein n=1 Tax=Alcaligenes sp. YSL9 TaxID=2939596 RepID=UPI00266C47DB|nr:DnaT-like ssDNA-binding protein [Alcaligenes sp. YSL9]